MEKFSYLDTVDFAATVCDKEGVVLYQNKRATTGIILKPRLGRCASIIHQSTAPVLRNAHAMASAAFVLHTIGNMASCPFA